MLNCEFPLGRPLGKPGDVVFQTDVIMRAFALLDRTDVPVLVDHPDVIEDESDEPESCPLPPRVNNDLHPALDEVQGLRKAYDRSLEQHGRTLVGRVAGPDELPGVVQKMIDLESGATLDDVGLSGAEVVAAGQDIRAYYEEAGLQLAANVTGARALESWFYNTTQTGQLLRRTQQVLKANEADTMAVSYIIPMTQQR